MNTLMEPKLLTDPQDRDMARRMRDGQWKFMERVAREGTVHVSTWNKYRLEEQPNELLLSLISGMELSEWITKHLDWFVLGPQEKVRYTQPVSLTGAGRVALANRHLYDMEPVTGGLVEPGWQAVPAEPTP